MASIGHVTRPAARTAVPAASDLEAALTVAVQKMRRSRMGLKDAHVDLEELAAKVMDAAIRDQHTFVLCSAANPAAPTAEEHRWAQSLAGAVASRFQRTARKALRSLKGQAPTAAAHTTRDADGCPAWCVNNGSERGCDWHESRPVAFEGPGDMYDDAPEPYEVMWAALSEVPQEEVDAGGQPGTYIYFDTLASGQGSRLDVAQTDALLRQMGRYMVRLQAMRDQLAALTADPTN
jgi:hypothetical protein